MGERGGRITGGRDGMVGVVVVGVGVGVGRTKRGGWWAVGVWWMAGCGGGGLSCSMVGCGGVLGGEGEGEEDIVMASWLGFGRRRLRVGCAGRTKSKGSASSCVPSSSQSKPISSMSSFLPAIGIGICGRRERGEEYCVAGVPVSLVGLCDELKLNRGVEANWEDDG